MEKLNNILAAYGVFATQLEVISERVVRVHDLYHQYALKRSHLTEKCVNRWLHVYHLSNHPHLSSIIPIYVTRDGKPYYKAGETVYYLMPWIESNREEVEQREKLKQMYISLAQIHAQTKFQYPLSSEEIVTTFQNYKSLCEKLPQTLRSYVEQFEANPYMSPFEWLVCTHYHKMLHVFQMSLQCVQRFIDHHINKDNSWNVSLCHGQLDASHALFGDQIYFINWERSRYENSSLDLANFLKSRAVHVHECPQKHAELFEDYLRHHRLNESEIELLIMNVLDAHLYLTTVEQYVKQLSKQSLVQQVMELEQTFRQLTFGLEFSEHVLQFYASEFLDDDQKA
ncbi:MAG TPA: hypothetical protein VF095_00145 [Bacillota bacterium]